MIFSRFWAKSKRFMYMRKNEPPALRKPKGPSPAMMASAMASSVERIASLRTTNLPRLVIRYRRDRSLSSVICASCVAGGSVLLCFTLGPPKAPAPRAALLVVRGLVGVVPLAVGQLEVFAAFRCRRPGHVGRVDDHLLRDEVRRRSELQGDDLHEERRDHDQRQQEGADHHDAELHRLRKDGHGHAPRHAADQKFVQRRAGRRLVPQVESTLE